MIDKKLLEILVCPVTHEPLRLEADKLINDKWQIAYPIRNGIPILLIDQAELPEGVSSVEALKKKIEGER